MRKIKEILRLCWGNGLSARQAALSCGTGRTTIKEYLDRAEKAGLSWPISEDLDEASLENLLFPSTIPLSAERRNMPSFDYLFKELKRKHVTLQVFGVRSFIISFSVMFFCKSRSPKFITTVQCSILKRKKRNELNKPKKRYYWNYPTKESARAKSGEHSAERTENSLVGSTQ